MTTIFYCELRAHSGQGPAVLQVLDQLILDTKNEPGAVLYAVHRDTIDPDRLIVYERYRDQGAGNAHMESAGVKRALEAFVPLLVEPPRLTALTWHGGFMR
jgi:quinol monooxygenase YgiN